MDEKSIVMNEALVDTPQDTLWTIVYSCFRKGCPKKAKSDMTIPKGSMGLSEESLHMLNIHMIKEDQ